MNITYTFQRKHSLKKALFWIIVFFIFYFVMAISAVALSALAVLFFIILGYYIKYIGIWIGLLVFLICIQISYFVIISLFKPHKKELFNRTQITQHEEPLLFKLIEDIAHEINTPMPHSVYLLPIANANVSVSPSFWNIFFQKRYELNLGIVLINNFTTNELRCLIAHELAHFAQNSNLTKNFIYHSNRILYNIFNDEYSNYLKLTMSNPRKITNFISNLSSNIAIALIEDIQNILQFFVKKIKLNSLALAREYEFKADAISAELIGSETVISSLHKSEYADLTYSIILSYLLSKDNIKYNIENIFAVQKYCFERLIDNINSQKLNISNLSTNEQDSFEFESKLQIENIWNSHPNIEERINYISELNITKKVNSSISPQLILINNLRYQVQMTELLFANIEEGEANLNIGAEDLFHLLFGSEEVTEKSKKELYFNGYYYQYLPQTFALIDLQEDINFSSIDLFSDNIINLRRTFHTLINDTAIVEQIALGNYEVKDFRYDGRIYTPKNCQTLLRNLQRETESMKNRIVENDSKIFSYFLQIENNCTTQNNLKTLYSKLFELNKLYGELSEISNNLAEECSFFQIITTESEILRKLKKVDYIEIHYKEKIREIIESEIFDIELEKEDIQKINAFFSNTESYYQNNKYQNHLIKDLNEVTEFIFSTMNQLIENTSNQIFEYQIMLSELQSK